jgi:predicted 3-demethylubiquinone-9 3-methyltransferase (glyoxalase superfamily)
MMQKITPHLWFDREAKEAAEFYVSLFPDSDISNVTTLHNTPSGDTDIISFELSGKPFMALAQNLYSNSTHQSHSLLILILQRTRMPESI